MSTTTMEEVFKAGFAASIMYNDASDAEHANDAWEKYRYQQLLRVSGKDVADDWLNSRMSKDKKPEDLKCPECEGPMKERSSQYGKFWGCSNYPRCKGTRDSEGKSKAERAAEKYPNKPDYEDVGPDSYKPSGGFTFKKG